MKFFVSVSQATGLVNHLQFSGSLDVEREVNGPLELVIELNRCDSGMKKCEKFPTQKFSKVCHMFDDKRSVLAGIVSMMQPPLSCPLKVQHYEAPNVSMDMTTMSYLPLSGSIFLSTAKVYSGDSKNAEMVLCTAFDMRIVRVRKEKKKNQNLLSG